jgi:hypothetical protein
MCMAVEERDGNVVAVLDLERGAVGQFEFA